MHNPACWRNTAVYLLLGISLAGCSGYSVGQRLNALEEQVARLDGSLGATDARVAQLERGLGAVQAQASQSYEVRTSKGKATNYVVVPVPPRATAAPVAAPNLAAPVSAGAVNAAMLTPATAGQAYPGTPAVAPVVPQTGRPVVPVTHSPAGPVVVPAPSRNAGLAVSPATAGTAPITTRSAQAAPQAVPQGQAPAPRATPQPVPRPVAPQPATAPAGDNGLALPPEGGNMPPSPAYQAPSAPPAPATPPAGAARAPQVSASGGGYQAALQQIMAGQYEQGRANMQQFLQNNPNSNLGANAHYWIGESYYAQKNYADALTEFKQVCAQYPQHHKTADALLKAGMTYQRLGDPQNADLQFKALVADFPRSQAAQVARSKGWGR